MRPLFDRIGACSWSLRARSPAELVQLLRSSDLRAVQLHLDPFRDGRWRIDDAASRLRAAGIRIASAMMGMQGEDYSTIESIRATGGVRRADTWPDNLRAAEGNAIAAQRMGIPLVTFHAGFLPPEPANPERAIMIDRLRQLAEVFASRQVRVALETGQENADTLLAVLRDLNAALPPAAQVRVNFDPANMILYAMGDPVASFSKVAHLVAQAHIKDARPATTPATWGTEVPVPAGLVDWPRLLPLLARAAHLDLIIERESGDTRLADIVAARDYLLAHAAPLERSA